jgi:tRNA pseudouridine13 synthase
MNDRIDISYLKQTLAQLPWVTDGFPGIGGNIKSIPEHFQVEEILPYAPCGEGEHVYVTLKRKGWNTADVARKLAEALHLNMQDIGWGGRKDKTAVTTQTFSLLLPLAFSTDVIVSKLKDLPFDILGINRHGNKIKTGHVAGNRFDVLITETHADGFARAMSIASCLKDRGLPNYYGEQRFGHRMGNIDQAAAILAAGRKARGRKNAFLISALQSALFNFWLRERMERGAYATILPGDVAKKTDTGGIFLVEDVEEAAQRFADHQIVYTGPIYGHKMKRAGDAAGAAEDRVLEQFGLSLPAFKLLRAGGSRRAAIVYPDDLVIEPAREGLRLRFTLPAGTYATTLLGEFTRT